MDGLIEDTFIANIQRLNRIKRRLYQCSRECNQFSLGAASASPKKQASRIIEALGMNPMYSGYSRRPKVSQDPNIVMFDIECGGARA